MVGGQQWNDFMFSNLYEEISLDDVCYRYWKKYLKKLEKNEDGFLLLEQNAPCQHRNKWLEDKHRIQCLYRSKRFVPHRDVLAKILNWMVGHGNEDSIVNISISDLACVSLIGLKPSERMELDVVKITTKAREMKRAITISMMS